MQLISAVIFFANLLDFAQRLQSLRNVAFRIFLFGFFDGRVLCRTSAIFRVMVMTVTVPMMMVTMAVMMIFLLLTASCGVVTFVAFTPFQCMFVQFEQFFGIEFRKF